MIERARGKPGMEAIKKEGDDLCGRYFGGGGKWFVLDTINVLPFSFEMPRNCCNGWIYAEEWQNGYLLPKWNLIKNNDNYNCFRYRFVPGVLNLNTVYLLSAQNLGFPVILNLKIVSGVLYPFFFLKRKFVFV